MDHRMEQTHGRSNGSSVRSNERDPRDDGRSPQSAGAARTGARAGGAFARRIDCTAPGPHEVDSARARGAAPRTDAGPGETPVRLAEDARRP